MSKLIELKPCPFCAGDAVIGVFDGGGVKVYCVECGVSTGFDQDTPESLKRKYSAIDRVVEMWNRRSVRVTNADDLFVGMTEGGDT